MVRRTSLDATVLVGHPPRDKGSAHRALPRAVESLMAVILDELEPGEYIQTTTTATPRVVVNRSQRRIQMQSPSEAPEQRSRPSSQLARVIAVSGLPRRRFARVVMARGERSLRHWLAEGPPPEIEAWAASIERVELEPHPEGGTLVHVTYRDTVPGPGRPVGEAQDGGAGRPRGEFRGESFNV